jgi:hypothetical protein
MWLYVAVGVGVLVVLNVLFVLFLRARANRSWPEDWR